MKIVVLVKDVPDTYGNRTLNLETGLAERGASESILDEINERALEVALAYADAHEGTEVVLLSMGPQTAEATNRKGLAMGAAAAIHIVDDGLRGADIGLTARTLAAELARTSYDLVITGNQSTDGSGGVLPAMIAERLQIPAMTSMNTVEFGDDGTVSGERAIDGGTMHVTTSLPALISITDRLPEARFPNFKGIMAAKKKPIETVTLSDLGVDPLEEDAAASIMLSISEKPPRGAGVTIVDDGNAGKALADFLRENQLA